MDPTPGAALIRAAAYPSDLALPHWPDLAEGEPEHWRNWLCIVWSLPGFAVAVASATPHLAEQVARVVDGNLPPPPPLRLRRLTESTAQYLLRWTMRATPFGRFAGVAPVNFGAHAEVCWGQEDREVVRPDGEYVAQCTAAAEQDLAVLRTVAVVTNGLGYRRGHVWVLPHGRVDAQRRWDLEVRLTRPVKVAIESANTPISFVELVARLAGSRAVDLGPAERLIVGLIEAGVLLSALRQPMVVSESSAPAARPAPLVGGRVTVDIRLDAEVTLPPAVLREAGRAASALVAVAPAAPGWEEYRSAFIHRWGPGAAVPLRGVLNALGFPAGYRSSARRAAAGFTTRDRLLAQLAQQSALDGCAEVVLDDELLSRLHGDDDRPPIPHAELRFTLAAPTVHDLDRGRFALTVVSGSRHAGVAAGRFLHLLTPDERSHFREVYETLPTAIPGAATVQLSAPPLDVRLTSVARTPQVLPTLPVGDFHPNPAVTVADLAVTGDGNRLWLVSRTTGEPIEPLLFNSVLLASIQQPLVRFLTEIWAAWNAPCTRFDWGQMGELPFLPRVRRGRSVLYSARWTFNRTSLPDRTGTWPKWRDAWQRRREQLRLPREVLVGHDDMRLRLDLDDSAHLAMLRTHINRHGQTTIMEAPGPAGWINDRPAEILLTLASTAPASATVRSTRVARPASADQHQPGQGSWLEARLYGSIDDILTDIANRSDHLPSGWWFLRYPDPEHHVRLRVPISDKHQFAQVAAMLAELAQQLDESGVLRDYTLNTYRPETRHGTGATLSAAEAVFAADSSAALCRLSGDRPAVTAAGMVAIADAFTGDGLRWLADRVPHRSGPRLSSSQLDGARTPYRDDRLAAALIHYRHLAERDGMDVDQVLGDLIHLHHARTIGVDIASEHHCLRLARTIARSGRPS